MNRLAYVMRVQHGKEPECRQAQTNMPTDSLQQLGIRSLESFIGSGYYILTLESDEADMQTVLEHFFNDSGMQGFFNKLRPHVEGVPEPHMAYAATDKDRGVRPGSVQHNGSPQVSSADLPLAASAYFWSAQKGTVNTGLGGNGAGNGHQRTGG